MDDCICMIATLVHLRLRRPSVGRNGRENWQNCFVGQLRRLSGDPNKFYTKGAAFKRQKKLTRATLRIASS